MPTRALHLFFECNISRPFVVSDILRILGKKTGIAKNYVWSRQIRLKNRFFGTQYVIPQLRARNLQFFSFSPNFIFSHHPLNSLQLSLFSALSPGASWWRLIFTGICVKGRSAS